MPQELPEVTLLSDARGERPENAAGIGAFWYETEVWTLPLPPAARVLYAGLCSYLGHGQINHRDLRAAVKGRGDEEISEAFEDLVRHNLLTPIYTSPSPGIAGYKVRSVREFEG